MEWATEIFCRSVTGLVFLVAGLSKLRDLPAFARVLHRFGIVPPFFRVPIVVGLPVLECMVGGILLCGYASRATGMAAATMLLCFSAAIAVNLLRGRRDMSCGCFGSNQTISWGLLVRNAAFLLVSIPVIWSKYYLPTAVGGIVLFGLALLISFHRQYHRPITEPVSVAVRQG